MDTRLEQTAPVREFATAIGEWLLARRFGSITPLAFRWRVGGAYGERPHEIPPHVVMDLLVNDPPPPPPEWCELSEEERAARPIREWARNGLWPREDMDAVREAARARALEVGAPDGIDRTWPVHVLFIARSDAGECGFPAIND